MIALRLVLTTLALLLAACGAVPAAPQRAAQPTPVPPTPSPEAAAASAAPDPNRVRLVIFDEPE